MNHTHVSDDHLIELCLSADDPGAARRPDDQCAAGPPDWTSCTQCSSRHSVLAEMLSDVRTAAGMEADAAFPADRLARQRARIMQRLESEGRPGRIIPSGSYTHLTLPTKA